MSRSPERIPSNICVDPSHFHRQYFILIFTTLSRSSCDEPPFENRTVGVLRYLVSLFCDCLLVAPFFILGTYDAFKIVDPTQSNPKHLRVQPTSLP